MSRITFLVMEIEANPRQGTNEEADYRKGLARQKWRSKLARRMNMPHRWDNPFANALLPSAT